MLTHQVNEMRGWGITNLKMPNIYQRGQTIEAIIQSGDIVDNNAAIYWVAPLDYLGNKVSFSQSDSTKLIIMRIVKI